MAAYGALVSVMHIIDQLQHHPRPPISIHDEQLASLTKTITFLQDFLEGYPTIGYYTEEEDPLESRIAEAAHAAEDVIESYIVDQICARSTNHAQTITSIEFYQGLQKVIEEMDSIKMEVMDMEIKENMVFRDQARIIKSVSHGAGSSRSTPTAHQKVTMVGFDDVLEQMLGKITREERNRQIIPIVGMGGIGKTTLARNIYVHPLVQEHFDVCAWSTISQEFTAQKILREILDQVDKKGGGNLSDELGDQLHKCLIGRRYLIVMDDMWSIEAWDEVRRFFPNDGNGSRVVITTRLSNLASHFNYSNRLDMKFLDEAASWNLFCKTVFGKEICPPELEDIGKKIVEGCRGLPLSIAVIGGLLSKSERAQENWESIEGNLSSIVNLEDNESCLQVLYMSYNNLPVYIKPCFLYMGNFPEDADIPVSLLIPLFVAGGFLKPINGRSLEEVAKEYLEELVDRNLLLVKKRIHSGKVSTYRMHDLLRDVCLREARKLKFLCLREARKLKQRRFQSMPYPNYEIYYEDYASFCSLKGAFPKTSSYNIRLLRKFIPNIYLKEESEVNYSLGLVNLRLLFVDGDEDSLPRIDSWVPLFWNLQTLVLVNVDSDYILEIWKMPLLRHVITSKGVIDGAYCVSGDMDGEDEVRLEYLQTLFTVSNLKFCEGVVQRYPNITKLKLYYNEEGDYYLNNLECLHKLESLSTEVSYKLPENRVAQLVGEVTFPSSLKKLTLIDTKLPWEDMNTKIGSLPLLEILKLGRNSCIGCEWETYEGRFSSLRFLLIEECKSLVYWKTENYTHFPRLEHLEIRRMNFIEIPLSMGDIPTLGLIELDGCDKAVWDSAKRIKEVQDELGNEGLQVIQGIGTPQCVIC